MKIELKNKKLNTIEKTILKNRILENINKEYNNKYLNYEIIEIDIFQDIRYQIIKDNIDLIQFIANKYGILEIENCIKDLLDEYTYIFHINNHDKSIMIYDYGKWSINNYENPYIKKMGIDKIRLCNIPYIGL